MSLVEIRGVEKCFGELTVLRGIDLTIEAGEVVAIIGRSGSGKSTLLRCINGLERYDSGSITVDGHCVDATSSTIGDLRQRVGMVFQSFNLFPHLTVGRNVTLAPRVVKRMSESAATTIARTRLAQVGLAEKEHAYPGTLSGGQQQRVAIARALAMSPEVLLCDEITSALDPELVGEVLLVLAGLASEGMTMILVTHEMRFAREVCDRLVFMHQGKIHESGPPERLFSAPETPELQAFLRSVS
jgi:polar amino acid transport system ATP-binding protein